MARGQLEMAEVVKAEKASSKGRQKPQSSKETAVGQLEMAEVLKKAEKASSKGRQKPQSSKETAVR